jgi:hypothetical protein
VDVGNNFRSGGCRERLKTGAELFGRATVSWARRVPPPLRFGAALLCIVSGLETGRDVGLAKSGFRPTYFCGVRLIVVINFA